MHSPAQVPDEWIAPYLHFAEPRRTFAGMLAALDSGINNVTLALKARNMWNDTLIWFQTDNGAPTPACGGAQGGQNAPLRGGKCSAWEGGLRGTAFVSGPGLDKKEKRGAKRVSRRNARATTTTTTTTTTATTTTFGASRVYDGIIHTTDVLPTLLSAAHGADVARTYASERAKAGKPMDGVDQWYAIKSLTKMEKGPRSEALLELDPHSLPWQRQYCGDQHGQGNGTGYAALRSGRWKLLLGDPAGGDGDGWYCTGPPCNHTGWEPLPANHTPRKPLTANSVQLYDVISDPSERVNRAHEMPDLVEVLRAKIQAYNASRVPSYICGPDGPWVSNGALTPWL